jgi:hypothetical protein
MGLVPIPGPIPMASKWSIFSTLLIVISFSSETCIASGKVDWMINCPIAGVWTLSKPSPLLSAAEPDKTAAPILPLVPATINAWP